MRNLGSGTEMKKMQMMKCGTMANRRMDMKVWVSYYLQNGVQTGATLIIDSDGSIYDEIVRILTEREGNMWVGIADYGIYED